MKQTARIISTYSADVFGVASALFELGGMTIMHDASGCNSTYTTHDEPRWYDMDSMVYISALSEMEAIMGDDEKLIGDIAAAAEELHPKFIALAGTPIPAMTGFDYEAVAELIEQRTGIPCFGFATTGMNTYVPGVSMALEGIARRFAKRDVEKTEHLSANILGLTPLDFSTNGTDRSIAEFLEKAGFEVISRWAMGSSLEELAEAGRAQVNLVVSSTGLGAAKALKEIFGTPYVVGMPIGSVRENWPEETSLWSYKELLKETLLTAVKTGENRICGQNLPNCSDLSKTVEKDSKIVVIGEEVTSLSLAQALEITQGCSVTVLCDTECDHGILRSKDVAAPDEEELEEALKGAHMVIADPMYQPICTEVPVFIPLPKEAFSGRLYRKEIPNLVTDLHVITDKMGTVQPC